MMKVVWLCHFANQEMKEYFNVPDRKEVAPWINNLIELFKSEKNIELHIVAPNIFDNTNRNFTLNGISYHFYPERFALFTKKMNTLAKILFGTNYIVIQSKISKIINKIKPDLIHLHGAENLYYSTGIMPLLKKFQILTSVQGFVRNSSIVNSEIKKRIETEEYILKRTKHFGVRTDEMKDIIQKLNPNSVFHFHNYPLSVPSIIKNNIGNSEPIDCLYFARLSKEKGIEDLLAAIAIVKKTKPGISLSVIGTAKYKYLSYLTRLCIDLNIEKNVTFVGFLPTQEDIYKYAYQSKICILPTYHDIIPGTIIESMLMKLPVIANSVGGIPELNKYEETIKLVQKNNIDQLAQEIIHLIDNSNERISLAAKAFKYASARFNNDNVKQDILKIYKTVLTHNI